MSRRPHPPTIVFDLDGTLVDTVEDIAAALDRALAPYGCRSTRAEEAAAMMGEGLNGFFWRALVAKRLSLPAEEAAQTYVRFIAAYRQSPVRRSRIYPGMAALLEDLRDGGAHTAVCTNKVEDIALGILEQLDLLDLLVGDTGADSSAAIAAGIPAILVSYGYSPVHVRALSTDVHVDSVHELRNEVLQFIAAVEPPHQGQAVREEVGGATRTNPGIAGYVKDGPQPEAGLMVSGRPKIPDMRLLAVSSSSLGSAHSGQELLDLALEVVALA